MNKHATKKTTKKKVKRKVKKKAVAKKIIKVKIRPSSLPLLARCGAAGKYKAEHNYGSEATLLGRAYHEALMDKAIEGDFDLQKIIDKYNLSDQETKDLQIYCSGVELSLPTTAIFEQMFKHIIKAKDIEVDVSGTPDVVVPPTQDGAPVNVIDYKTGRINVSAKTPQLKLYAFLVSRVFGTDVVVTVVNLRSKDINSETYTKEELDNYEITLVDIAKNIHKQEYCVGEHCNSKYCPGRFNGCPAYAEPLRAVASLKIVKEGRKNIINISPDKLGKYYVVSKTLKQIADTLERMAKAYVDEHGKLDCGNMVCIPVKKTTDKIDVIPAVEVLKDFFGEEDWLKTLSCSKTAIFNLAKEQKKKGVAIMELLNDYGCITKKEQTNYKLVEKDKLIDKQQESTNE